MRDFDERKAEIFRRSEKRIAQRKRRRRVIISCIPLVICAITLSFVHVPKLLPAKGNEDKYIVNENAYSTPPETQESKSYSSVKIQRKIQDDDYCKVIEEPESVEKIVYAIEKYNVKEENTTSVDEGVDCTAAGDNSAVNDQLPEEDVKEAGYRITVTSSDGSEMVYTIIGDCLSDLTSGRNVFLSESQLSEISSLLADSD